MREIKFRAWDNVDYMSTPFTLNDLIMRKVQFIDDTKVMQYTGIKDKNGKEIYEGDIVERKFSGNKAEIKFIDGQFCYCDLVDNLSVRYPNCNDIRTLNNWGYEIIGNIYENPNLLLI